jgi:hypothetical protein
MTNGVPCCPARPRAFADIAVARSRRREGRRQLHASALPRVQASTTTLVELPAAEQDSADPVDAARRRLLEASFDADAAEEPSTFASNVVVARRPASSQQVNKQASSAVFDACAVVSRRRGPAASRIDLAVPVRISSKAFHFPAHLYSMHAGLPSRGVARRNVHLGPPRRGARQQSSRTFDARGAAGSAHSSSCDQQAPISVPRPPGEGQCQADRRSRQHSAGSPPAEAEAGNRPGPRVSCCCSRGARS